MSHFAKVLNKKVVSVIRAEQDYIDTFVDETPGEWIQTSYNTYGSHQPGSGTAGQGNAGGQGFSDNASWTTSGGGGGAGGFGYGS